MTATDRNPTDGDASPLRECVIRHIERTLHAAVDGRRAARALAEWTRQFDLSEAEFQLLWRLRSAADHGSDQTTLAKELALSPAQISATVERMRAQGWICQRTAPGDRRRNLWQLAAVGEVRLEQMLRAAASLCFESSDVREPASGEAGREAAA